MTVISIRLTGGGENRVFENIEVNHKIQHCDLLEKIEEVTNIPIPFQLLKFRRKDLPNITRPIRNIKFGEEIVVKHSQLFNWNAYVCSVKKFENAQDYETKFYSAEGAQGSYNRLFRTSFFTVYPSFDIAATKLLKTVRKFLNVRFRWIEDATEKFFALTMFKGQNPVVEFEEPNDGTRPAVICNVTVNSITLKFKIKSNYNAGKYGLEEDDYLDLIELYCYKLLESIGVGSKIVFIPKFQSRAAVLYIGSKWLADFQSFNSTDQVNTTEVSHAVVQIHFLAVFFSLGDVHEKSFGINASSDPIILDFKMSNYEDPKHEFLHESNVIGSVRARDVLYDCDSNTRLQIAKAAIRKWNLMEKLREILKLVNKEKRDYCLTSLKFDKTTRDLEKYVENVRSNIQDLLELPEN